jgi:uncharacterized MnhB-related membrane protein
VGDVQSTAAARTALPVRVGTSLLALPAGGFQGWFAVQLVHNRPIYSEAFRIPPRYVANYASVPLPQNWPTIEVVLSIGAAILLIAGAALALYGRSTGGAVVIAGSAAAIAHTVVGWLATQLYYAMGASDIALLWFTPNKSTVALLGFAVPVLAAFVAAGLILRRRHRSPV